MASIEVNSDIEEFGWSGGDFRSEIYVVYVYVVDKIMQNI